MRVLNRFSSFPDTNIQEPGDDWTGQMPAAQLYLDLMKKALSFTIWKESSVSISRHVDRRPFVKRHIIRLLSGLARLRGWEIVEESRYSDDQRSEGKLWPMQAHTMIGLKRLDNIQFCVEDVLRRKVPGDLIETGVWRGGACIFMRAILAAYGVTDRRVFVADSFKGLPPPDTQNFPQDSGDRLYTEEFLAVSREDVEENFQKYGLLDSQVVFLEGFFKDTLPTAPIDRLAVVRLDGDMYASTFQALNALYPKLSTGGYCIIDDYALPGARQATDDFRRTRGILAALEPIDFTGMYWRKE